MKRAVIACLLSAICALAACAQEPSASKPMSAKAFRDRVQLKALELHPGLCVRNVDDMTFKFGPDASDCDSLASVENMYALYLADPAALDDLVGRLARSQIATFSQAPLDAEDVERLVALPRPTQYTTQYDGMLIARPLAGDVFAVLMLDSPESLRSVNPDDLAALGVTEDEAFARAAGNLPKRIGKLDSFAEDGIEVTAAESGLATGLMLLPSACPPDEPGRLFLLADREYFVSVPVGDQAALERFWNVAIGSIRDRSSLSSTVLQCRAGEWTVAQPPGDR